MKDKKLACFYITGELLLKILKEKSDLPRDTKLVLMEGKANNPIKDVRVKEFMNKEYPEGNENVITVIATSKKFFRILDDAAIPVIDLKRRVERRRVGYKPPPLYSRRPEKPSPPPPEIRENE